MRWKLYIRNYKVAGIRNLHFKIRVISTVLFGNKKKYVVHYLVEFEANIFSAEHI